MKAQHMEPHEPSALAHFVSEFGSLLVAGVLGFVGWDSAQRWHDSKQEDL